MRQKAEGANHTWDSTPPDFNPLKKSSVEVLNPCSLWSELTLEIIFPLPSAPLTPALNNNFKLDPRLL